MLGEQEQTQLPKELCSIRIGFPVTSDEQAIEYKKKISEVLTDIPNVRIEFSLSTIPTKANMYGG